MLDSTEPASISSFKKFLVYVPYMAMQVLLRCHPKCFAVVIVKHHDGTCRLASSMYFFFAVKVWDMRTKACIHTLTGHTSTVAVVKCQAAEPQVSKQINNILQENRF